MYGKKTFATALLAVTLISLAIGAFASPLQYSIHQVAEPAIYVNVHITLKRAGSGEVIELAVHNLLTNGGKNFVKTQLGDLANASKVLYISLSNDASAADAAWTNIPAEIAANGLTRALGTYASTGTGTWTVAKTFTCTTAPQAAQLAGISWDSDSGGGGLFACATFTAVSLQVNDQLTVTWSLSCT